MNRRTPCEAPVCLRRCARGVPSRCSPGSRTSPPGAGGCIVGMGAAAHTWPWRGRSACTTRSSPSGNRGGAAPARSGPQHPPYAAPPWTATTPPCASVQARMHACRRKLSSPTYGAGVAPGRCVGAVTPMITCSTCGGRIPSVPAPQRLAPKPGHGDVASSASPRAPHIRFARDAGHCRVLGKKRAALIFPLPFCSAG